MPTATAIQAELRPAVVPVEISGPRHQLKLRLDVFVDGKIWQTFGFQTAPYKEMKNAKTDAISALDHNPVWARGVVGDEFRRMVKEVSD